MPSSNIREVPTAPMTQAIEKRKQSFRDRGMVLEVICDTKVNGHSQAAVEDTMQPDMYRVLVLSDEAHNALVKAINDREADSDIDYDFVPWQVMVNHPLTRRSPVFEYALNEAERTWQAYQMGQLAVEDAAADDPFRVV